MISAFKEERYTDYVTEEVTKTSVKNSVSSQPRIIKKIKYCIQNVFRSFLQTTRPQQSGSGGLQKELQTKDKHTEMKTAAGSNRDIELMSDPLFRHY